MTRLCLAAFGLSLTFAFITHDLGFLFAAAGAAAFAAVIR